MRTERRRAGVGTLLAAACAAAPALAAAQPAVVTVSPNAALPGSVATVAEAVRRVAPGGRVVVTRGTYREPPIAVDKPLTLEGRGLPTLDGEERHEIVRVTAPNVTVRGLRFARVGTAMVSDLAALRVTRGHGCVVEDNRFDDTFFGVYLAKTDRCRVARNVFAGRKKGESASGNGIHLWSARDVEVVDNRVAGHRDGIYFEFVRAGRVARNVSEGNLRYGMHFMYSDSCTYEDNTFRGNGSGVAVMYTKVVTMAGNRFVDNPGAAAYGLLLKEIDRPTLVGNTFARNTVGLMADGTTALVARGNVFAGNGWAVRLMANVQEGRFEGNDFAGNTFDVATNGESASSAAFAGNYFDEYRGWDLDKDGRGDVAFRPVRLFSLLVGRYEPALVLQRSFFVGLLDAAERVLPALTPADLADAHPAMRPVARLTTTTTAGR